MSEYIQLYKDAEAKQIVYPYTEIEAVKGLRDELNKNTKDVSINCPSGSIATLSNDNNTYTTVSDGVAYFPSVELGTYALAISKDDQSVSKTIEVKANIEDILTFFAATIAVTYPAGSTCTCSDGSTTLIAPDTSGSCTFTVPNTGTWTVTATSGNNSDSKSVYIGASGQSISVSLFYSLTLYENGELVSWSNASNGAYSQSLTSMTATYSEGSSATARFYTTSKIDLTKYGTAYITLSEVTASTMLTFGVTTSKPTTSWSPSFAASATNQSTGEQTIALDLSSVSGENYVVVTLSAFWNTTVYAGVTKIYLE